MRSPLQRLPWWVAALLGVGCAALGVVLVLRPFTSLSVLALLVGIGFIATGVATIGARRADAPRTAILLGVGWIAAGVVVLAWPDITTRALAIIVGVSLIVDGLADVVAAVRRKIDEPIAELIGGLASVIFGILALTWPDVTILVVAIVAGVRLVLFGLRLAWRSFVDRNAPPVERALRERGAIRKLGHLLVAVVSLVVALGLAGLSSRINEAEPKLDAFYDTPDEVPAEPGQLLRAEPFSRAIPSGAQAWRILYTTTRADGVPAVASGIVVAPEDVAAGAPVIAWAHGTTGVARKCGPSVLDDPWTAGAFFSLDRVLERDWILVATDYIGLGADDDHPYLVGQPAGRAVLDAVRAARQLDDVEVGEQTVVWGHSQGGGAALWTGVVQPAYAPDVPLSGVAALAPASDLAGLVDNLSVIPGGSIFAAYVLDGFANAYDDVQVGDYVEPAARTTFDEFTDRCLNGSALASALTSITTGMEMFRGDLAGRALGARLAENVPTGPMDAPLLIGQGAADQLVLAEVQEAFARTRCEGGGVVDFRVYEGKDHVPLVEPDSPLIPELLRWTEDRLAGVPAESNCPAG